MCLSNDSWPSKVTAMSFSVVASARGCFFMFGDNEKSSGSSIFLFTHRTLHLTRMNFKISYGDPQGSVLGPVLFTLYTTPLSAIISSFDINLHLYVDYTHIYMSLSVLNAKESLEKLQHWLMAVSAWMTGSKLNLNPSKTEFLLIGTKLQWEKFLNNFPCLLLGQGTNPYTSAKSLGVLFDSSLNFWKHISQTCRASFYHILDLRRIRKSLVLWSCQANCSGARQ